MFRFDNTYARHLDESYAAHDPTPVAAPELLVLNDDLATELGLDPTELRSPHGIAVLAGNELPDGATPIAQAYAGHQFGSLTPQLGDGRAILLGEHITPAGDRRDIVLKGAGRTPFSRGGDGRSALGPALREHLVSEAMHALAVPTTRSLAVVGTGESVNREGPLPGAVLTRVASSHLRVGTFQFFAIRQRWDLLARLVDYALARHDPDLVGADVPAIALLEAVGRRQAALVADWMHLGFIHGVMNTDNSTISGETIDYGPCAFVETHEPDAVFSSIDHGGRYAYGNQPSIATWNLARLAEALLPLLDPDTDRAIDIAQGVIERFPEWYDERWIAGARHKLALTTEEPDDRQLAHDWEQLLHTHRIDHTLGWRFLADEARLRKLFDQTVLLDAWLGRWHDRLDRDPAPEPTVIDRLHAANPILVPRNHHVEAALAPAVESGELVVYERLLEAVRDPFVEHDEYADLAEPAPEGFTARYRTFCGT